MDITELQALSLKSMPSEYFTCKIAPPTGKGMTQQPSTIRHYKYIHQKD